MTDVEALNAVVVRLVGKEIVGADVIREMLPRWKVPVGIRLRFYGGGEVRIIITEDDAGNRMFDVIEHSTTEDDA